MLRIKKYGANRIVTKEAFENTFKSQGYILVADLDKKEEPKEENKEAAKKPAKSKKGGK